MEDSPYTWQPSQYDSPSWFDKYRRELKRMEPMKTLDSISDAASKRKRILDYPRIKKEEQAAVARRKEKVEIAEMPKKPAMVFKVGDTIRLRKDLSSDRLHNFIKSQRNNNGISTSHVLATLNYYKGIFRVVESVKLPHKLGKLKTVLRIAPLINEEIELEDMMPQIYASPVYFKLLKRQSSHPLTGVFM